MFLPRPDRLMKDTDDKIAEITQVIRTMPNDKKCLLQAKLFNLKLKKQRLAALSRLSVTLPVEQGLVSEIDMMIAESDLEIEIEAIRTSKKYRRTERRRRERMLSGPYARVDRVQNRTPINEQPLSLSSTEAMENIHQDLENLQCALDIANVKKSKLMCNKSTITEAVIVLSVEDSNNKTVPFKKRITSSMTPELLSPTGGEENAILSTNSSCAKNTYLLTDNMSSLQENLSLSSKSITSPTEQFMTAKSSPNITSPTNQNTSLNTMESLQSNWFENTFEINSSVDENLPQIVEQNVCNLQVENKKMTQSSLLEVIDKINNNKTQGKHKNNKDKKNVVRDSTNLRKEIISNKNKLEKSQCKSQNSHKITSNVVEKNISRNENFKSDIRKDNLYRLEQNKENTETPLNLIAQNMTSNSTNISKELTVDNKILETPGTHRQVVNLYNTYQKIYSSETSKVNADISKDSKRTSPNNQDMKRSSDVKKSLATDEIKPQNIRTFQKSSLSSKVINIPQKIMHNNGNINNKENQPSTSKSRDKLRDNRYTEHKQKHLISTKSSEKTSKSSANKKCDDKKSRKKPSIDKNKITKHLNNSSKNSQSNLEQTSEGRSTTQDSLCYEKVLENGQISAFYIREMVKQAVELNAAASISQEDLVNDLFRDLMASKRFMSHTDTSSDKTASCRECGSVYEGHMCAYTIRELLEQC